MPSQQASEIPYVPEILTSPSPLPSFEGKRLILEIGPGRGDFLFQLAEENPEHLIVAIECKRKRYEKLILRIAKRKLENVVLIKGEAQYVLQNFLKNISFEKTFILFSDPWPKKRHAKNRLIKSQFLTLLTQFMTKKADLIITTDDEKYAAWMQEEFEKVPNLKLQNPEEIYPGIFETFFAQKWKEMGKTLQAFYLKFKT